LRWLVVTVGVIAVTIALPVPSNGLAGVALLLNVVATFLLPVALGVALTRRDGLVLPRVLVYGVLSVLLLIAFLAIVGVAEALFGARAEGAASVVAAGVVAVTVAPLRTRLQHAVDRLVYGDRGDPYEALSDLGRRQAAAGTVAGRFEFERDGTDRGTFQITRITARTSPPSQSPCCRSSTYRAGIASRPRAPAPSSPLSNSAAYYPHSFPQSSFQRAHPRGEAP
jgi:hypothetical protein